jgi:hypothetical protein
MGKVVLILLRKPVLFGTAETSRQPERDSRFIWREADLESNAGVRITRK